MTDTREIINRGSIEKVRVVYLAGDGRSGTTVLSRILGSYDGCIAVGELYDIWIESMVGDRICSCGDALRECEFWTAVMEEVFGEVDRATIEHFIALRSSVQSVRHMPFMLYPRLRTRDFNRRLKEYVAIVERLYVAIKKVSNCDVIIDSSKLAAYALALSESPAIDVRLVHVMRDSRACVYSWHRLKRDPVAGDRVSYLQQRGVFRSAMVWELRNATLGWASRRFNTSTKVRYEDFVRHPHQTATRLANELGLVERSGSWTRDDELHVSRANHIFAGNPNRVEQGTIQIRADDEWRVRMSRFQKISVSALTWPLLWKLGYLGAKQPKILAPEREMVPRKHGS